MQILDRHTFNASFFSLFIALNCFILERTALSIGLSEAFPSLIQGCSNYHAKHMNQLVKKIKSTNQENSYE